jgi:hypothetical protein
MSNKATSMIRMKYEQTTVSDSSDWEGLSQPGGGTWVESRYIGSLENFKKGVKTLQHKCTRA